MKTQSYEEWIKTAKPFHHGFIVLNTQEEKCKFCKEYIIPCIIDILTRDWPKVELPPIEEYTWEVITPYTKDTNERRDV